MHIERNVFENSFNTVIEVKGKIKENIKIRMDIALFCHHKNMELVYIGSRHKSQSQLHLRQECTITCLPMA